MAKRILLEGCETLRDGDSHRVEIGDLDIGVFRIGEKFYAIGDECPHQGASLSDGWAQEGVISCPWHCWQFDIATGHCLTLPGFDVPSYKIHCENGAVFLEIEDSVAEAASTESAPSD